MKSALLSQNKGPSLAASTPPGNALKRLFCQTWSLWVVGVCTSTWNIIVDIFHKCPKTNLTKKKSGETCVLTGGTRGIGIEILKKLLQLDFTVIVGVRNVHFMESQIIAIRKSGVHSGQVKILELDLKSLRSVKKFAENVLELREATRIDLLINNAAVYQTHYEITEDNLEAQFQVNYLSHYLLTKLLLSRIIHTSRVKKGGTCHIVNTTSVFHYNGNLKRRLDNLVEPKLFVPIHCYFDTKLCQVMHAKSIQAQLEAEGITNVQMYAVHPGNIPSEMWDVALGWLKPIAVLLKPMLRSTEGGADVVLHPAISPETSKGCGCKYFETGRLLECNAQANDLNLRQSLQKISEKLIEGF